MQIYVYYPSCRECTRKVLPKGFVCTGHAYLGAGARDWTREHAENVFNHLRDSHFENCTELRLYTGEIELLRWRLNNEQTQATKSAN